MTTANVARCAESLIRETEKIIIGRDEQIRLMLMAILAEGHVLLEDLPGSGKTTLAKTLSLALGCDYSRIQFTPDLLPSDVVGMKIYNQKTGEFQYLEGPVKTHILLADEINRAIPRTQAALLEAMEEKQVTIEGETSPLPAPFVVMATQNPVEGESTFPLPVAQMDRFFVRLSLGYLSAQEEVDMLSRLGDGIPFEKVEKITSPEEIRQLQKEVQEVFVSDDVKEYIVALTQATRTHKLLRFGVSPRAARSLFKGGKAYAAMAGRDFVTPDDIQKIAFAVLTHRISLQSEALFSGHTPEQVIADILAEIPVPPAKEDMFHVR
ncbi:MAG: MoxR family ATPase [Firmicutes bacterium]|nr:MoxR family ATPase [Clostridiales bacterium]MBQ9931201.1 MoxR family ATPase [Bacillota bacterium]